MCFILIFVSELGDKTQLLVLSFSTKDKAKNILFGVAIGTFFSHGLAILFGSKLGDFQNETFRFYSELFTYCSFLLFGFIGFLPKKEKGKKSKSSILEKITSSKLNYIFIIVISIIIGELGDKTFLASLGMGLQYPKYRISLILGSICGMVASNSIALFFGKILGNKLNPKFIETLSNILFIIFGLIGLIKIFF
jgi:putative Ca2+/H+ antiporter (TMEM165/GDT1 family)